MDVKEIKHRDRECPFTLTFGSNNFAYITIRCFILEGTLQFKFFIRPNVCFTVKNIARLCCLLCLDDTIHKTAEISGIDGCLMSFDRRNVKHGAYKQHIEDIVSVYIDICECS